MTSSTRFAAAAHILVELALEEGPVPSERLAGRVNTHPTVVRRLLMSLADAGLTTSRRGSGGGALLDRLPEEIPLLEVYRAVERMEFVAMHGCEEGDCGPVAANILPALSEVATRAEEAFQAELGRTTIADVAAEVTRRAADSEEGDDSA